MGQRARRENVLAAQRDRVDPHRSGGTVQEPLHHVIRLGPAGAAIDTHRRRVGEERPGQDVERADVVDARHHANRRQNRRRRRRLDIGPDRVHGLDRKADDPALGVERHRRVRNAVAAMIIAGERFRTRGDPFDRPAAAPRRPQHQRVLGIGIGLHPEAAAHIGRDHAQPGLGDVQNRGREHRAHAVRVLRGGVKCIGFLAGAVFADRAARLQRIGRKPLAPQGKTHDMRRLGERGVGRILASRCQRKADIPRAIRPHQRRARCRRRFDIGHGRERLVADAHEIGGIARLGLGLRHDEGDAVADAADMARRRAASTAVR